MSAILTMVMCVLTVSPAGVTLIVVTPCEVRDEVAEDKDWYIIAEVSPERASGVAIVTHVVLACVA